jgi:uncharacterized protein
MKFSRYNHLFRSEKYGQLLYNSLTNSFLKLDDESHTELLRIRDDPDRIDPCKDPAFFMQLTIAKVLVREGEEETLLNLINFNRLRRKFDNRGLSLTIAPTLACNFNCSYCFEENRTNHYVMDDDVEGMLLDFVKRFTPLRYIDITWYGGEPLLCADRIESITGRIRELDTPLVAAIITNGYLLTDPIINRLDEWKIRDIQITIDGDMATHDGRRVTRAGGKTYRRIIANVERLMECWNGRLNIRVNIDRTNRDQFHRVYELFMNKFADRNISVTPGFVCASENSSKTGCQFDREAAAAFTIEQYREHGIKDLQFYPKPGNSGCIATKQNGFIIGPRGEVYSCWRDVGVEEKTVGCIKVDTPWDMGTIANYIVGTNPFNDEECQGCFYLPVCDGGCPELRYQKRSRGVTIENSSYSCSYFKGKLADLLSIYYEIKEGATES